MFKQYRFFVFFFCSISFVFTSFSSPRFGRISPRIKSQIDQRLMRFHAIIARQDELSMYNVKEAALWVEELQRIFLALPLADQVALEPTKKAFQRRAARVYFEWFAEYCRRVFEPSSQNRG
jgi:hypothetical protein